MKNKVVWIGTKESDILHTNHFFSNSITACGSGKSHNISFSVSQNRRINYNVNNPEYTQFLLKQMEMVVEKDSEVEFMYYNPYYAHLLNPVLLQHVCCLNSKSIMDMLRSKCEMRTLAAKYIPIVPYERVLGKELYNKLNLCFPNNGKKYIIQQNISSGGEGTFVISDAKETLTCSENEVYLLSPYYEKNIPINVNFIIFDEEIFIFPPSIQIIQQINGKLLFKGTDFNAEKYANYLDKEVIWQNTFRLASALKAMGYRGICGFDYIQTKSQLLFLECNPRFQASTYLLNLTLEKEGLPSIQELNYMAFNHRKAVKFDAYTLNVTYSCIAPSYQTYLKNSSIREEWFQHPSVFEILTDGLKADMHFVEDAYLYRVIFSKSITDITPEFDLISYDNLQTASEDWYKKIISGDLLALKIGLLNQGIFISKAALNFIQNYGGIKDSVFDSIDLILNNGIIINCPYKINYADFSPFFLEYFSGQLELHYYDKCLGPVSFEPNNPDKDRITRNSNVPYRRLSYSGGDRLRIHHTDICVFKRGNNCCQFCNLPVNGFDYTFEDIQEVIDFYLTKGGFRHILIGGGSESISHESDTVLKIVHYIREKNNSPIYLMCLPIQNDAELESLYHAGITEIGFNIEIWDDKIAKKLMPGKGRISRETYMNALKNARKIWKKPYSVRSLLIVGLEPAINTEEAVHMLCQEGIMPILSVFRPLPNSQMSEFLPPTNEILYNLYKRLDKICNIYNQHLGPNCTACQNNTLSLPW